MNVMVSVIFPTVSIVLHVYHRSGIRGHRMGRCVRYYRIKSKNAKQFIRQIEMKIMKKQRMTKRNLIPKQQSKFEQTSIVDETNLENRNKRSQSTGDVLIHSQLCRLTDNRAHSLTLDDMEIFETSKPIQEDQQIEQQQQQLNDNNQKQKDTDTDSTADNDNDDDNFFQTTNDLNKKLPLRSSWRRKNFYKRRESLDEYLQRKVFKIDQTNIDQSSSSSSTTTTTATSSSSSLMMDNNRILKFQSNNPWLNYIKTCGRKITWQSLTNEQILMYESMFELIVTEKSYLVRLENLISLLKRMPELAEILSSYDQKILFGNLQPLFNINQSLYNDFARSFHEDCFMHHMFVVFEKYFNEKFEPYIEYIRGQNERDQVMANKKLALAIPKDIKMMQSSFITPMQRITRYPLLLKTILDRMKKLETKKSNNDEQLNELKNNVQKCFESATKFSMRCDNALNELFKLQKLIEFRKKLTGNFAHLKDNLVISGREIYRQASIKIIKHICLLSNDEFKDVRTHHSMLILLTDLLMLADYKQRKDKYKVIECERLDRVEFSCGSLVTSLSNDDSGSATLNTIKFLKSNQTDVYQFVFALSDELEQFFNKFKELKFNLLLINQQQLQQPQQLQQQQQQPQRSLSLQSTTITDDSHRQNHQQKPNHKLIISDENGKISCKNLIVCPINSLPINVENNENGHHDNSGDDDKDVKDKIFKAKFNASF
ncbi:Rho guanine nucleotide exchange factor 26 [Dermatophagoides pteronyssinus]|uniref:Rho guanine nucleotide exchange factor 26 n=1 Tax=Dermatophagoides pteronyssinus TaxID=6956 RepID=A0ABQ8J3N1_DERPT|nr:Rho guanine nucleotide exchange factor 26 [Dermatophagoides pteronyssinus]